jgi:hypothetical protein
MKQFFLFFFVFSAFSAIAQQVFENKKGGYKIFVPEKWIVEQDGEITDVYAPDEGEMDTWKERLEISLTGANDLTLDEAFTFYIEVDLPPAYKNFAIVRQGEETFHGLQAKWVLFSFSGSGTVGETEVSFTLYNLFYLKLKDNKLFLLNGIAEKDYFAKLESDYLKIVRSFQITK